MRHKYRRNCRSNTLRQAATLLSQFLIFYRDNGKQHIEQMTREDIEAFDGPKRSLMGINGC